MKAWSMINISLEEKVKKTEVAQWGGDGKWKYIERVKSSSIMKLQKDGR